MKFAIVFLLGNILLVLCEANAIEKRPSRLTESPPVIRQLPDARPAIAVVESRDRIEFPSDLGRLDEVPCILQYGSYGPSHSLSWNLESGNSIYLKLESGACAGCTPEEPMRVDSISLLFVRPDGSAADTIDFDIQAVCPAVLHDSCDGPGPVRSLRTAFVGFEEDIPDGNEQLLQKTVLFPSILLDSTGGFIKITNLGFRGESSDLSISIDDSDTLAIEPCQILVEADDLIDWTSVWPNSGGPRISAYFACGLNDSIEIPPCAEFCTFRRYTGPPAYYDPFATSVYQLFDPSQAESHVRPQSLGLDLYFENVGSADDIIYLRVVLACPGFGDICCPPGEALCQTLASVRRGTPFQTVLEVEVPFVTEACCIDERFWLGVIIDSVSGGSTLPSFLFSSIETEADPPLVCEQWTGSEGNLSSFRQDNSAWANLELSALCGSCGEVPTSSCDTESELLDCESALTVSCSESGVVLQDLLILPGTGNVTRYCCTDLQFPGRELVCTIQVPNQGNLSVRAIEDSANHFALFLLESCVPQNCVAFGIDSLAVSALTNGVYFVVVEKLADTDSLVTIELTCIADCNGIACLENLQGPGQIGNRYLDSEGDGVGNVFYQSYYPGSGTTQTILRFDGQSCDTLSPIVWTSAESSPNRMLAFDPRNGGEFWCGTTIDFFSGIGKLYRISSGGGVVQSWTSIPGLPIMRWSGAAFDPSHNHMWVLIRDSSNTGSSRAFELDLSNPFQPVVIQGPHALPHQSSNFSLSCAGADYAHLSNSLLVVHQGTPDDFVQCYTDADPGYLGPRPGPGLVPSAWCAPDSNSLQGYAVSALEDSNGGSMAMMNFTDIDWAHPVVKYPPPCRLIPPRCIAPNDLTLFANGFVTTLTWTAHYPGTYRIYSSQDPLSDGDPDNGLDPLYFLEATIPLPAGDAEWVDSAPTVDFKVYSIVLSCSTLVEQRGQ